MGPRRREESLGSGGAGNNEAGAEEKAWVHGVNGGSVMPWRNGGEQMLGGITGNKTRNLGRPKDDRNNDMMVTGDEEDGRRRQGTIAAEKRREGRG